MEKAKAIAKLIIDYQIGEQKKKIENLTRYSIKLGISSNDAILKAVEIINKADQLSLSNEIVTSSGTLTDNEIEHNLIEFIEDINQEL